MISAFPTLVILSTAMHSTQHASDVMFHTTDTNQFLSFFLSFPSHSFKHISYHHQGFPIWQALLNAVHNGIKVRILTNNYEDKPCARSVTNLDYLLVAGADVKYYTSTTFSHSKYMMIDGTTSLVSSINYSKASLTNNREAGIIIYEEPNKKITHFLQNVFDYDFSLAKVYKTYNFSLSQSVILLFFFEIPNFLLKTF